MVAVSYMLITINNVIAKCYNMLDIHTKYEILIETFQKYANLGPNHVSIN